MKCAWLESTFCYKTDMIINTKIQTSCLRYISFKINLQVTQQSGLHTELDYNIHKLLSALWMNIMAEHYWDLFYFLLWCFACSIGLPTLASEISAGITYLLSSVFTSFPKPSLVTAFTLVISVCHCALDGCADSPDRLAFSCFEWEAPHLLCVKFNFFVFF